MMDGAEVKLLVRATNEWLKEVSRECNKLVDSPDFLKCFELLGDCEYNIRSIQVGLGLWMDEDNA